MNKEVNQMESTDSVIQFVGYSNSGKTTLVCKLIERFTQMGIRLGVIKHDGHDFELDQQGKDTWNFRQAGAPMVAIQSATQTAWMENQAVPLPKLISRMSEQGAELIIVEGFKRESYPKIVVIRREKDKELLDKVQNILAVVSWLPLQKMSIPVFFIDQEEEIFQFVDRHRLVQNKKTKENK
ncbi:molybdopterin-guanine dinucleotide biosynthesis protein B [Brevibacillus laterosporus]|uniref:Molybdopterin-guanine dinucleotide biosynthesis protein B n=1 Tax=Brevibacillus halotolerans TaxID=1507437 RepID=A0ABT4I198_9BACL|nr:MULTISPECIES: molybdopterin-guanine dinucleotide biosynthesis protein B [Brevibacillus]MCR8987104.1 molybdopterin-guanine dinucleotide biosynthesis protein B [Brevibacillus laterosporus]MCZ0832841.1 molybdopterin-guanine dinucleotide biosynthesis protein B [Brevibacillus halotolerans]GIO02774.1 molybdopterin-guanine dinucleotide biosynthesis protein MobB [Brevibacillus halotolerans]